MYNRIGGVDLRILTSMLVGTVNAVIHPKAYFRRSHIRFGSTKSSMASLTARLMRKTKPTPFI